MMQSLVREKTLSQRYDSFGDGKMNPGVMGPVSPTTTLTITRVHVQYCVAVWLCAKDVALKMFPSKRWTSIATSGGKLWNGSCL
ncbi:hypothetical protein LMH87_004585 [Akanthomyces muscarius]|uniref:Uncharacterized protein n=1 Tax=Akanthomyces muscarius TaxID=2231603 RepID=A0A9W8Q5N0_AKAMU|nr:hypothetical protein LMH87_004585 [Akanthomyces muscarius]KAJ4145749.1 hypothetical protein LMH87_004585 [Akanthomyces muscarius]